MANEDRSITFTPEALSVFPAVERLIDEARRWVLSGDWLEPLGIEAGSLLAKGEFYRLKDKVAAMERSWFTGVIGLIKLAGGFGNLRITKDNDYSLYFYESSTGFAGGLIYHPAYNNGDRLPYGDWSTHT